MPDVKVVDPTGAGDGFNGGCLVGLARGEQAAVAAVTGCVAASFVIQVVGAAVPAVFSGQERAERHRQCDKIEPPPCSRGKNGSDPPADASSK